MRNLLGLGRLMAGPLAGPAAAAPAEMIREDKHWLSDVVAGAGRSVSPIVARHARGVQMSVTF